MTTTPTPIPVLLGRSALSKQAKSLKATLAQAIATRDQELEDIIRNLQTLKLSAVTLHGIIEGFVTFARYSPIQLTTILSRAAYIELYNATARSLAQQTIVLLSLLPSRQVQAARTQGPPGLYTQSNLSCQGCRGLHSFYNGCQELQDLVDKGKIHFNQDRKICYRSRERPGPPLSYLPPTDRLATIKEQIARRGPSVNLVGITQSGTCEDEELVEVEYPRVDSIRTQD